MKYEWDQFDINYYYPSSLRDVFSAWSTCDGLKSFFIENITITGLDGKTRSGKEPIRAGDRYSWTWRHDYSINGEFRSVVSNERVEFTFGSMLVSVQLKNVSKAVLLQLKQTHIPVTEDAKPTSHMNCRICWTFFLTNLKSVLLNGTDLRDHDPLRASSFEVGYQPKELAD